MIYWIYFCFSVSPFLETRGKPTSYHASASEKVQKSHNSWLQDFGCGHHQYVTSKFFGERFKKNFDFSPYLVVQYMVRTLYDSVEDGICSAGKKSSANT